MLAEVGRGMHSVSFVHSAVAYVIYKAGGTCFYLGPRF